MKDRTLWEGIRRVVIGEARDLSDGHLFHRVSLVALLAWVGLGADGLSSSCYGPEEAFKALGSHISLAPLVGLASLVTIAVICISYAQIIELFPGGGGGYLVSSKLLSPAVGVVSGCALLVDYVLTIALSVASGADALFSVLPPYWIAWRTPFVVAGIAFLTVLNLRGVREAVLVWAPVFFLFVATHAGAILIAIVTHLGAFPSGIADLGHEAQAVHHDLGWAGLLLLLARAYSVGAGTYTGIEAVSNGLPVLREPRVATGKRTMLYMGLSLAITVGGLLLAYTLFRVTPQDGKTLNAVLFERITATWPPAASRLFVSVSMVSAMALLFIAAQAGFLDGPRVLANMALDRWAPSRFSLLSDRLVTQNGILLMGAAAVCVVFMAHGSVGFLVVLYSINVFVTFSLSQLGMVRHWWTQRTTAPRWRSRLAVNGLGLCLTLAILVMLTVTKFRAGGWVTLLVTGAVITLAFLVHRHYRDTLRLLARLDQLVPAFTGEGFPGTEAAGATAPPAMNPNAKTAVVFVNGFNGLGLHTVLGICRMFPNVFRNFVFIQVGRVDAGNFKGAGELDRLRAHVATEADRYAARMRQLGFCAETAVDVGTEVIETAGVLAGEVHRRFPNAVFFGGQLAFARETWWTRLLHNDVVFALQRQLFREGLPFLILPIRV